MAAGCFLFCTRQVFMEVGGFDEGIFAAEEVVLSSRLKKVGRFVILREQVIISGRKLRAYSALEITRAFVRIALLGAEGLLIGGTSTYGTAHGGMMRRQQHRVAFAGDGIVA
jgi:hypothetical protein